MDHAWVEFTDPYDYYWTYYGCKNCELQKAKACKKNLKWSVSQYGSDIVYYMGDGKYLTKEPSCAEIIMNQVMQ